MYYRDLFFQYNEGRRLPYKKGRWFQCVSCGKWFPKDKITVDHIIPTRRGGVVAIGNLQPMCRSCNSGKNAKITFNDFRKASIQLAKEGKMFFLWGNMLKRYIWDLLGKPYDREKF